MPRLLRIAALAAFSALLFAAADASAYTQTQNRYGVILGRAGIVGQDQAFVLTISPVLANGGTFTNDTNNVFTWTENSENLVLTFTNNLGTFSSSTGATFYFTPAVGITGDLTLDGGAGALTLSDSASSILIPNNDTTALDVGSSGLTAALRFSTATGLETVLFNAGEGHTAVSIADTATLDASDCGKPLFVTAGIDTKTITLPALSAVPNGCVYQFFYVGADGGALLDISPNAADGIEGSCTLAASVVELSGTDDADIGLTKATIKKGDTITLTSGDADDWYASAIQGICANN